MYTTTRAPVRDEIGANRLAAAALGAAAATAASEDDPETFTNAVLAALTRALDARDQYTARHSVETSDLAAAVSRRLRVRADQLILIHRVALLHDIGKLGIPLDLLCKRGPLDPAEEAVMREHPVIGQRILAGIPHLAEVALAVRSEHERWDGGGYPDGLSGERIPLASRIVFVCDAWHAMSSDRPYRRALPRDRALGELRDGAGTQFDPRVTAALLDVLESGAACGAGERIRRGTS